MESVEGPLPPPFIAPRMQWEMAKDAREREALYEDNGIPMHWNGLLRLGYMNAIYYSIDVSQHFIQRKILEAFKKNITRERKRRYYVQFFHYYTLVVGALEARLPFGPVVEYIASFLMTGRDLCFFQRYIGHRSSVIENFFIGRYRVIAV